MPGTRPGTAVEIAHVERDENDDRAVVRVNAIDALRQLLLRRGSIDVRLRGTVVAI
jgi:hypothetical protein